VQQNLADCRPWMAGGRGGGTFVLPDELVPDRLDLEVREGLLGHLPHRAAVGAVGDPVRIRVWMVDFLHIGGAKKLGLFSNADPNPLWWGNSHHLFFAFWEHFVGALSDPVSNQER